MHQSNLFAVFEINSGDRPLQLSKFTSSEWRNVGDHLFEDGVSSFGIDNDGKPHLLLFRDDSLVLAHWEYKKDSSDWPVKGGIAVDEGLNGEIRTVHQLAFSGGNPYVAYSQKSRIKKAVVRKFEEGDWKTVGKPGLSRELIRIDDMALSRESTPFVAVSDEGFYEEASVLKFGGGAWKYLGNYGFSSQAVRNISIKIHDRVPYVVYIGKGNGKVSVRRFMS
ncbi:MAG: hypothetical protein ABEH38_08630 [Flavobacteriales bacterium]